MSQLSVSLADDAHGVIGGDLRLGGGSATALPLKLYLGCCSLAPDCVGR